MFRLTPIFLFLRKNALELLAGGILAAALAGTWVFLQKRQAFPEGIHIAIQEEFQKIVKEKILKKNPLAQNIKFYELWTETTDQTSQIKAVFSYSFNESGNEKDTVKVTVRGSALINRQISATTDKKERWQVGSFEVDQTEMDFDDEVLIITAPGAAGESLLEEPNN